MLLLRPGFGQAQPLNRQKRIGILGNIRPPAQSGDPLSALLGALRDVGWSEGSTLAIEYRWAEQRYERFDALARELVAAGVDLIIVTGGVTAALAAQRATLTIPILAVWVADPVRAGLVASLARPGGNVTGLLAPLPDWGKFLELARDAVPGATRVAVIGNPTNVVYADYVAQNEAAARQLGLKLQMIPVAGADELAPAFDAMQRERAEVLVFGPDGVFLANLEQILERARAQKLPVIAPIPPAAQRGALASYGLDLRLAARQAASYADRLLRGVKPADLPIEAVTRFELIVNRRVARALGLTLPQALLLRADEVID
ncbi:MAG: ABC transporter substrate-binding protein [Caldimonas sp.]